MSNQLNIYLQNTQNRCVVKKGISLREVLTQHYPQGNSFVVGALVNHKIKNLDYKVSKIGVIQFIGINHSEGMRMYSRSLTFLLYVVVKRAFPKHALRVVQPISGGIYCELVAPHYTPTEKEVSHLIELMQKLIDSDKNFNETLLFSDEAFLLYQKHHLYEKALLLQQKETFDAPVQELGGFINYFYGRLLARTGEISLWDITKYKGGFVLRFPKRLKKNELRTLPSHSKLFDILREYKRSAGLLGIHNLASLNDYIKGGRGGEIIKVAEALHEKKIAEIANHIAQDDNLKIILVAGPSSSGKTTFSKRLAIQMWINGHKALPISMDNFFFPHDKNPILKNGKKDFESINALDVHLLQSTLEKLIAGESVRLPKFNFSLGERTFGEPIRLPIGHKIVLEGIHALNPILWEKLDQAQIFRIYVSALTAITIDEHNLFSTKDNRFIRRIIRDGLFRSVSAEETINRWEDISMGEEKNIFPFQEYANVMFNSSSLYELAVLKDYVLRRLEKIPQSSVAYVEAYRLKKLLSLIWSLDDTEVPPTSIIREFIGGSSFSY